MSMLLPSPFPCDARRPSLQRFARYTGRSWSTSPAPEPIVARTPVYSQTNTNTSTDQASDMRPGTSNTCRALHALLGLQAPSMAPARRITTPLRASPLHSNARIVKRPPLPPRGLKKRRRDTYEADEADWACDRLGKRKHPDLSDLVVDSLCGPSAAHDQENLPHLPSTPKRQCRRVPTHIPFGLERADFYDLDLPNTPPASAEMAAAGGGGLDTPMIMGEGEGEGDEATPRAAVGFDMVMAPQTPAHSSAFRSSGSGGSSGPGSSTPRPARRRSPRLNMNFSPVLSSDSDAEAGHDWSEQDDRQLVELVLDKLRLSRRAWNECARQLGADQHSLGMRWKFLLDEGQVGLKLRKGGGSRRVRGELKGLWS